MARAPSRTKRAEPRKAPTQERARVTVDAILQATADVVRKKGLAGLTTNHVAERAGVSVGTLYQYFPNKDALVTALGERHVEQVLAWIAAHMTFDEAPFEERLRRAIALVVASIDEDPALHRALSELGVVRSGLTAPATELHRALLAEAREQMGVALDVDAAAVVLVSATQAIIGAYASGALALPPARVVDEVVRVFTGYLAGPSRSLRAG